MSAFFFSPPPPSSSLKAASSFVSTIHLARTRAANTSIPLHNNTFADYMEQWAVMVNETLTPGVGDMLTWNIGARDCGDYDNCFGITHSTATCVCYPTNTAEDYSS